MKKTIHKPFERNKSLNIVKQGIGFCLSVALLTTGFSSCLPDEPSHPPTYNERKLFTDPESTPVRGTVTAPEPDCKTFGRGCIIPILPTHPVYTTRAAVYAQLQNDYAHNNMALFFSRPNTKLIFPNISNSSEGYQKIVNGDYKLHFMTDSTIIVYKNGLLTNENMVFAVKWK